MTTLCLVMIVKNEAPVIGRCLSSVGHFVNSWCIVDTGSADGTQDAIRNQLDGLPYKLFERPWIDFAHNRTEALELARPLGDYSLVIDADDVLRLSIDFRLPDLTADSYTLNIEDGGTRYHRTQIFRNALPWRYRGVLHEFPVCEEALTTGHLPITMVRGHDGARRRDPETYRKDAEILYKACETETDPVMTARYCFYLAQSWRDCGEKEKALGCYLARTDLDFWIDEIYISWLNVARLLDALDRAASEIIRAYQLAIEALPARSEAYHGAAKYCRLQSRFSEGHQFAREGLTHAKSEGGLFVESMPLDYGLLDELAVNGYWSGHYREAVDACDVLLTEGRLPEGERSRVVANANFARRKLLVG